MELPFWERVAPKCLNLFNSMSCTSMSTKDYWCRKYIYLPHLSFYFHLSYPGLRLYSIEHINRSFNTKRSQNFQRQGHDFFDKIIAFWQSTKNANGQNKMSRQIGFTRCPFPRFALPLAVHVALGARAPQGEGQTVLDAHPVCGGEGEKKHRQPRDEGAGGDGAHTGNAGHDAASFPIVFFLFRRSLAATQHRPRATVALFEALHVF